MRMGDLQAKTGSVCVGGGARGLSEQPGRSWPAQEQGKEDEQHTAQVAQGSRLGGRWPAGSGLV